ncbi:MAG TPA: hypothetical protein VGD90_00460 [Sphingobacteriaceae bacterium]
METLPIYISITFILVTFITVIFFFIASRSRVSLVILILWLLLQGLIARTGFYTTIDTYPQRFMLLIGPPLAMILGLFVTPQGRHFLDRLDPAMLTLLHVIRIPVEVVLYWLFLYKTIPELMTFEGRNFDILSGITAPLVYYFGFIRKVLSKKIMILWNVICLGLLLNIVINAILSAPLPFQKFAFDQPNQAVLHFPFNWLPACVVPLVLFSHLATIRKLLQRHSSVDENPVMPISKSNLA